MMRRIPLLALIPPIIFAALAGLFLGGMYRDDPDALPSTLVGRNAPPLVLTQLNDMPLPSVEIPVDGEVRLINYWASWCAPCRIEHPQLMELAEDGVQIIGVNYKDDPEKAAEFLASLGDPYTATGADLEGRTAIEWGVYGVPETFVVDRDGVVRLRVPGPVTRRILERDIRPLLEPPLTEKPNG